MSEIDAIVQGGKANAGPPLGPSLSQAGVNVADVIAKINEKTKSFDGMEVPVKVIIDDNKNIEVEVGSPPVSAMIKKELNVEKLAEVQEDGTRTCPGDISLDAVINIAKSKDAIAGELKNKVKQVLGTCLSVGVTVDGKEPKELQKEIDGEKIEIKE
jgi:large subunit ribosomal protein L11